LGELGIRTKIEVATPPTDTNAVAALFVSQDEDGNKTGILYDWPELEE